MEAFAIYVKLWFAHTPSIPDKAKDSARRTAESRFAQFQEYVVEQFQGGRRFVDDLPREVIANEAELSRMASEASAAPASGAAPSERATRTAINRRGCRRRCVERVPSNIGRDEDDELEAIAKRTQQRSRGGLTRTHGAPTE